jgi:uncharacterized protein YjiK
MINRQTIMQRAWAIFRQTYRYPAIPFSSIGRPCFASCLAKAWREAKEAAAVAAVPAQVKAEQIAGLRQSLSMLTYSDDWQRAEATRQRLNNEISRLAA